MILLDTNILIYALNGNADIIHFLESLDEEFAISVITYLEIIVGSEKNGMTHHEITKYLDPFTCLPVSQKVAEILMPILKQHQKKSLRDVSLQDYFIGATAVAENIPICTNNKKDFSVFSGLEILPCIAKPSSF